MGRIILSAFADEHSDGLDAQLKALCDYEISNIELRFINKKNVSTLTKDEVQLLKRALADSGISVSAIGSPIGKIQLDGELEAHLEMAKRVFDTANTLGTPYVRAFSFYSPCGRNICECKDEVFYQMERLVDAALAQGITLCHENEAGIYGDVPHRVRELYDNFGGKLRTVFDMGNYVLEGIEPLAAYDTLKDTIAYFHIKDALFEGAIVPPGKGDARIAEILNAHKNYASTDVFASLEPHLQTFSGLNALVGRTFDNPYKYETPTAAFTDAVTKIKEILYK